MTGYLFSDFMNAVVWRMREQEALGNVRLTVQTPYFISTELQQIVYEALLQVLKEIPNEDFEGLSSLAVQSLSTTVSSGYAGVGAIVAPLNTIRVLGATVDTESTVGSSPKAFVQEMSLIGGRWTNRWTMIGGKFLYIGTNAVFTVLTEPTLAQWSATDSGSGGALDGVGHFTDTSPKVPFNSSMVGWTIDIVGVGEVTITGYVSPTEVDISGSFPAGSGYVWSANPLPVLPPGYDIRAVDLAHKRVLIADYVPAWRP